MNENSKNEDQINERLVNNDCEKNKIMLSAMVDNELPSHYVVELNDHMVRCEFCRQEYDQLCNVSNQLNKNGFEIPEDERMDQFWNAPYTGLIKKLSFALICGGILILFFVGLYQFFILESHHALESWSVAAIFLGMVFLFATIIINRIQTYKTDPYKEVKR